MFINKRYCFLLWMLFTQCAEGNYNNEPEVLDKSPQRDYVDPHSFYYSKHDQKEVKKPILSVREQTKSKKCSKIFNDCINGNFHDVPDDLFSRRLINKLLSITTFEEDDDLFIGNIVIELTSGELARLKNFGLGKVTVREVDSIISHIFHAPKTSVFFDMYSVFHGFAFETHGAYSSYILPYKEYIFVFIAVIQLTWLLVRTRWTYFKIFFMCLVVMFGVSFIITYLKLLQEAEIKLTAKQFRLTTMPVDCQPHKMSWYQKLFSFFSTYDRCEEYYTAVMDDHRLHVTPAQAMSRVMSVFFLAPAGEIGKALGDFVHHSTGHLPAIFQWIVQPLLLIAVIAAVIMGIILVFSNSLQSLALNSFSMLRNSGTDHTHPDPRNITSKGMREPIEVILNLKVSADPAQPLAIARSGDDPEQRPTIANKEFRSPRKLDSFGGGDADQVISPLVKEGLSKKENEIDGVDHESMDEIKHAGGDADSRNIRQRKPRRDLVISEMADSDND